MRGGKASLGRAGRRVVFASVVVLVFASWAIGGAAARTGESPGASRAPVGPAIAQIKKALATDGCSPELKALYPGYYGKINANACQYLRRAFGSFAQPRGVAYGTGAEIDFKTGGRRYAAILAANTSPGFDVLFVRPYPLQPGGGIDGGEQPAFRRSAATAVRALRSGNCDLFLSVAYRVVGIGAAPDKTVCKRLGSNKVRVALAVDKKAAPVAMGGNETFSFFALQASGRFYTIVMAKQPPLTGLPPGAALYAFVGAYPLG